MSYVLSKPSIHILQFCEVDGIRKYFIVDKVNDLEVK